jgi:hypothetical protein
VQPSGTVTFLFTDIEGSTPKERLTPTVVSVASGVYRDAAVPEKGNNAMRHSNILLPLLNVEFQ